MVGRFPFPAFGSAGLKKAEPRAPSPPRGKNCLRPRPQRNNATGESPYRNPYRKDTYGSASIAKANSPSLSRGSATEDLDSDGILNLASAPSDLGIGPK